MQKQICLQYKDAMEEYKHNMYVFLLKQIKKKNKKCNVELDPYLQSGKKKFK